MKEAFSFVSFENITVHGYYWSDVTSPKKVIILVHGMAETIARYDMFAAFLVKQGYAVMGYDQRGHGKTAIDIDHLGHLGTDGWQHMKYDLKKVVELARAAYDAPVFILGHSMGSFVTRDFLFDFGHYIDGVILSGTGYQARLFLKIGYFLARFVEKIKGGEYPSVFIDHLTFRSYTRYFKPVKTKFDWLSRDEKEVMAFVNDPYCGALHPVGFFRALSENVYRILYNDFFKHNKTNMPMLIFSGMMDPVGGRFKGVKKSAAHYKRAGFLVTLKGYEQGRHEMLNEINRDVVYHDILNWLERQ
jgi:alpha-beta hydrolase superfamily lysophospholipase